jgi:hypothetical protein
MHILAIGKQPFLVFLYKNMTKIIHIWTQPCSWRGVLYTTLCHKVCQWFAAGRLFSLDTPVFLHPWNWPPRYNRNIVDIGVKHHNPISEHKLVTTVFGYLESLSSYKSKRFVFVVVLKAMVVDGYLPCGWIFTMWIDIYLVDEYLPCGWIFTLCQRFINYLLVNATRSRF